MISVGIDPGKHGAIVVLDENKVEKYIMPLIGKELDVLGLSKLVENLSQKTNICAFVEDVHAIHGVAAKSTFNFGYVCGIIHALLIAYRIPYILVQPKIWQAEVYQGIPEIRKPSFIVRQGKRKGERQRGKVDTKKMSLLAAQRLYPEVDLIKNKNCTIPHDGIVDALLIAHYGKIKTNKIRLTNV